MTDVLLLQKVDPRGSGGGGRAICVTSASPRVARQTERSRSLFSVCLSSPPNGSYHWSIAATVAVVEALKKKEDTETAAAAAGRIAPPALHSVRLSAPWHWQWARTYGS